MRGRFDDGDIFKDVEEIKTLGPWDNQRAKRETASHTWSSFSYDDTLKHKRLRERRSELGNVTPIALRDAKSL
jgi:hypothetical protein